MKIFAMTAFVLVALPVARGQNLVPNPSFELYDICPHMPGFNGGSKPLFWDSWNESPEYFNACAGVLGGVDTLIGVPQNGFGFQYPLDGHGYVGVMAYDPWGEFREYVGCQLVEPLEVGETYELSFFTSVGVGGSYWWTRWACNNMGMLFTMQPNAWTNPDPPPFALRDHAHLYSQELITDTANWSFVSGTFVADSAYQYMVIGNFFSRALTDTLHLVPGPSLGAYYFVDNVCVTKASHECGTPTGVGRGHVPRTHLWPNPTSGQLHVQVDPGASWWVYDATGRLVAQGVSSMEVLTIALHQQAPGQYVLRLDHGRQRTHHRFIIYR